MSCQTISNFLSFGEARARKTVRMSNWNEMTFPLTLQLERVSGLLFFPIDRQCAIRVYLNNHSHGWDCPPAWTLHHGGMSCCCAVVHLETESEVSVCLYSLLV